MLGDGLGDSARAVGNGQSLASSSSVDNTILGNLGSIRTERRVRCNDIGDDGDHLCRADCAGSGVGAVRGEWVVSEAAGVLSGAGGLVCVLLRAAAGVLSVAVGLVSSRGRETCIKTSTWRGSDGGGGSSAARTGSWVIAEAGRVLSVAGGLVCAWL